MPRVTREHVETTKKSVITVERSTNRGITDTLTCLVAMQGERTDARVFIDAKTIHAMKLVTASLDHQLESQAKIAEAHGVMTDLISFFAVPDFGPGGCVPNTPGGKAAPERAPMAAIGAD